MPDPAPLRLPLLLAGRVLFPCTELRLPLGEALFQDLLLTPPEQRFLGVLLALPGQSRGGGGIYPAGTVSRVLALDSEGGTGYARLRGDHRFELLAPPDAVPYPQAPVRLLPEPPLDENAPLVRSLRQELAEKLDAARHALGSALPLDGDELRRLSRAPLEEMVNRAAVALDVPELRQLQLLSLPVPDRALEIVGILRSRIKLVALLRPFRHLAAAAEEN
jgi:hypothetical protein